ncbi:hypothetical protein CEXT_661321 [Caerostris extrusa]|uniref:Uncharacterized protein n=1 Tax=Caerostris extrusa TaxID=172846 RepID=A0AAV4W2L9_CAEEX|nr:hypothetical protein CEXT_661321 [Caerostris extrusa]
MALLMKIKPIRYRGAQVSLFTSVVPFVPLRIKSNMDQELWNTIMLWNIVMFWGCISSGKVSEEHDREKQQQQQKVMTPFCGCSPSHEEGDAVDRQTADLFRYLSSSSDFVVNILFVFCLTFLIL